MEAALEAILFVSSEPIPRERLLEMFAQKERETAQEALEAVLDRYRAAKPAAEEASEEATDGAPGDATDNATDGKDGGGEVDALPEEGPEEGRGVMVDEVAGGIRLVTRPELGGWLRRFFEVRGSGKLSMAALETLAIVAYRQPVTSPEIQELRGVSASGVLKTLLERRLIRIAGRKEVVGNPFLYRTTKEFLVHFGLGRLKELPPLEEFEETFGLAAEELGLGSMLAVGAGGAGGGGGVDSEEEFLKEAAALDEAALDEATQEEAARDDAALEEAG